MQKQKEFTIGVYRPGPHRLVTEAEVDLLASATELLDLFQRARINNERDVYEVELLACKREFLWEPLENQTLGVHDLNYLAWRLAGLEEYENGIFEGLCKMETSPPAVDHLINMTYSMWDCAVMWDVRNDTILGKQSFEDDFFSELVDISDDAAKYLDYAKIGKERRLAEHGVFTSDGYVVNLNYPNLNDHFKPGQLTEIFPPKAGLVVFLKPRSAHEGKQPAVGTIEAALPISEEELAGVLSRLGCSHDELEVIPKDCLVPSMMQHVQPDEDIGTLNAFAVCCEALHGQGKLPLYKAVLEATGCASIAEAADLGVHIDDYRMDA